MDHRGFAGTTLPRFWLSFLGHYAHRAVYHIALGMHFLSCRLLRCLVSLDYICKYDTSFITIVKVKLTRTKAFAITSAKIVADFYHISYLLKIKGSIP